MARPEGVGCLNAERAHGVLKSSAANEFGLSLSLSNTLPSERTDDEVLSNRI